MTGRTNSKLVWTVALGMLWAWLGLLLAIGAPEREPLFELGLKPGQEGTFIPGRVAEIIEDQTGIRITMDWVAPPDQRGAKQPDIPKLPAGIDVKYIPPAEHPMPPRIEVVSGVGPVRLPSGATLVAARDYIFKLDRGGLRIVPAPPGSALRRRLEWMEQERRRHPMLDERRENRRDRWNKWMDRRGGHGEGGGEFGPGPGHGEGPGGPGGPPPEGGQGGTPPGDGDGQGGPPPPPDGQGERGGPGGGQGGPHGPPPGGQGGQPPQGGPGEQHPPQGDGHQPPPGGQHPPDGQPR